MSEMSKASAPPGGDPLEVMPDSGAKDDVLPGPPAGVDPTDTRTAARSDEDSQPGGPTDAPASGEPVNASTVGEPVDPESGRDPLDSADTEGARTPGVGGSESGADPMPDMAGTQRENPPTPGERSQPR